MGGVIAITIRYSDGEEWRSSCWTNILPDGLFTPAFFSKDPDRAERHVRRWQKRLVDHRAAEPVLEQMYGNWNKLAPLEYGQIVVDFKTKSVISGNGYSGVHHKYTMAGSTDKYPAAAYRRVGATVTFTRKEKKYREFTVDSFWKVNHALSSTGKTLRAIRALGFKISAEERKTWSEFLRGKTEVMLMGVPHGRRVKTKGRARK